MIMERWEVGRGQEGDNKVNQKGTDKGMCLEQQGATDVLRLRELQIAK